MKRFAFLACAMVVRPAFAQVMDPAMPGMDMGAHAGHHVALPAQSTDGAATGEPVGTDQSPGSAEPPPIAHDRPADRFFDPAAMAAAMAEGMGPPPSYSQIRLDIAEYQFRNGRNGFRWEGEAWTGDLNRFVFRSKGEGAFRHGLESAELQGLYSRALNPWWNLQVGVRQDIRPQPARSYATIGIEGLAPYKFDVLTAAYLSDKGQLTGRIEATVDERLSRRFVLQPRIELDFSAQDMPAQKLGAGLNSAELGLRLRYEISRQFAPYVGFDCTWATGTTAAYARASGEALHQCNIALGIRSWL